MTLKEIQSALSNAMQTGKLGTPVAARVQVMLPADFTQTESLLPRMVELLSPCFDEPPTTVRARRHESGRLTSILMQTESGRTMFITIGLASRPALHLLVVGNHGIVRLEGADDFQIDDSTSDTSNEWSTAIKESCDTGRVCRWNVAT